ncbi:hypothetical protein Nepgr_030812 [Nepenthes gracilis]|uniref:glutathione transferase n=1 Tax=Nepenthes gracilis TaxID=150966 RepID=A0AAD3TH30_NEPGR|nr:hypothetical protein Nepgr_030812 [Nepenthes gracilis]
MAEEEVKLHGAWGSPFSKRVEFALKLKGIHYHYIEEEVLTKNKSPELLKYNPVHKKIPVLLHKGRPIAESQVILEYIDETWKGYPILPQEPYERATARFWARFIDEKCWPSVWSSFSEGKKEEAIENLKLLEKELEGKKFFGGEKIGFVDIVANFIAYWVPLIEEATGKQLLGEEFPALCRWKDEYVSSAVIKEHLPSRDKLVAHFRARFPSN